MLMIRCGRPGTTKTELQTTIQLHDCYYTMIHLA
jgi:hypothetical protein